MLGRVVRAVVWLALFLVLSAGGAGLVGQSWHPPGGPTRAELTYTGDTALNARLDAAGERLALISSEVERLATEAKVALEEVASTDLTRLRESLQRGAQAATTIDVETESLRASLADLPGDDPSAIIAYSNETLVRRSVVLAAIDAAESLTSHWGQVASRSTEAANLSSMLALHDQTVADAAAEGVKKAYENAIAIIDEALLIVVEIQKLRVRLIAGTENTVLDEWVQRNAAYDTALRAVYQALVASNGQVTAEVVAAQRGEAAARANLPPDRRTIIVILAEVSRGGLTEAVIAIEDAHGRIDEALVEPIADALVEPLADTLADAA